MTLSRTFKQITQGGGGAVQSFDFYDLSTGRGSKTIYAGDINSGAVQYKMSPIQFYSDIGQQVITDSNKLNFEMKLNRPLTIEGDAIINVPAMHYNPSGTVVMSGALWAYLYTSGAAVSLLGSAYSNFYSGSIQAQNSFYKMHSLGFIIPTTSLRGGDYLRIKIELSGAQAFQAQIGCDPMGRTSTLEMKPLGQVGWGTTTALTFQMPMRIDI